LVNASIIPADCVVEKSTRKLIIDKIEICFIV
jgi:hypothetical protein